MSNENEKKKRLLRIHEALTAHYNVSLLLNYQVINMAAAMFKKATRCPQSCLSWDSENQSSNLFKDRRDVAHCSAQPHCIAIVFMPKVNSKSFQLSVQPDAFAVLTCSA